MNSNVGLLLAGGAALIATGAAGGAYFMNKGDSKISDSNESKESEKSNLAPVAVNPIYQAQPASPFPESSVTTPVQASSESPIAPPVDAPPAYVTPIKEESKEESKEQSEEFSTPQSETPLRGGRTRCKHCNQQLQFRKKSRRKLIA